VTKQLIQDGSKHDYGMSAAEVDAKFIKLYLKIYKLLDSGNTVEQYLKGSTNRWKVYKLGSELWLNVDYRIKQTGVMK